MTPVNAPALQLLYTVGPMVESLLRCKADNYLVFRLVHRSASCWQFAFNYTEQTRAYIDVAFAFAVILFTEMGASATRTSPRWLRLCDLFCCSFVWRDGKIRSVPASRADIFKDRSLSPSDKRILMRFLKNTVDALNGEGPLKVGAWRLSLGTTWSCRSFNVHMHKSVSFVTSFSMRFLKHMIGVLNGAAAEVIGSVSPEESQP